MKKAVKFLLLTLTFAMCLSACGKDTTDATDCADPNVQVTEEFYPDSEEPEPATTPEPEPTPEPHSIEYVTYEADLSFLGDLVNDLVVITNDETKQSTKDDVFNYLKDNGYDFYEYYKDAEYGQTITPEEAYKASGFLLKPAEMKNYTDNIKKSAFALSFRDFNGDGVETLETLQCVMTGASSESRAKFREDVNNIIDLEYFESLGCEIHCNNINDDGTWESIYIRFKGDPTNPAQICDYFYEINISSAWTLFIQLTVY